MEKFNVSTSEIENANKAIEVRSKVLDIVGEIRQEEIPSNGVYMFFENLDTGEIHCEKVERNNPPVSKDYVLFGISSEEILNDAIVDHRLTQGLYVRNRQLD